MTASSLPILEEPRMERSDSFADIPAPPQVNIEDQKLEIARERACRADRQVARWKSDAGALMSARHKFLMLLAESRRHEILRVRSGQTSLPDGVSDPEALVRDINVSYKLLLKEAIRLFDDRESRGIKGEALNNVAGQATSSFASLYPWSDGVACRDIPFHHPAYAPLTMRNGIFAGQSGMTMLKSFNAALSCSQIKLQAALMSKELRVKAYAAAHGPKQHTLHRDPTTDLDYNVVGDARHAQNHHYGGAATNACSLNNNP